MIGYLRYSERLNLSQINIYLLLAGFAASVILRVGIGGREVAYSWVAGILFAACLVLLSIASGTRTAINYRVVVVGFASGLLLLIPALLTSSHQAHPLGNYATWAAIVSVVAMAEEFFLRGALFNAVKKAHSDNLAIIIAATAFALLHVPLYGWHVVPLDFFVGLYLGVVRSFGGSWVTPGIAHTVADLAGWWLV